MRDPVAPTTTDSDADAGEAPPVVGVLPPLRAAMVDDASSISEIARALGLPSWRRAAVASWLASPTGFGVVATGGPRPGEGDAENLVGFVLGSIVLDEACLLLLAVLGPFQRQGVGAALLGAFEARARDLGATSAYLEVAVDNGPARSLYETKGYEREAIRRRYYADGRDALVLRHIFASTTIAR
ncbi:MAG: GNAT family N-acetyltransferase [Deltaproteobacteria bacterium]|nr:GNAT family N-acetyltransferase [Deltaproteobacteria bacterium]